MGAREAPKELAQLVLERIELVLERGPGMFELVRAVLLLGHLQLCLARVAIPSRALPGQPREGALADVRGGRADLTKRSDGELGVVA